MLLLGCVLLAVARGMGSDGWKKLPEPKQPGAFPLPRLMDADYRISWSGAKAGEVTVHYSRLIGGDLRFDAEGKSTGLARGLWRLDATHSAVADPVTLRPRKTRQKEVYQNETVTTEVKFEEEKAVRRRETKPPDGSKVKDKRFKLPLLFDIHGGLLFVRSQKLVKGEVMRFLVFPTDSPYLGKVTVLGREKVKVGAGSYAAIKCDLALQRIDKKGKIVPHADFKKAQAWFSDDADRLLLKIDSEIFIGSVRVELESVKFR